MLKRGARNHRVAETDWFLGKPISVSADVETALPETAIVLLDSHTGSLLVGQDKKRDQKLKCKYFSNNNKRPSFLFESVS